jgi:hypothetical protein
VLVSSRRGRVHDALTYDACLLRPRVRKVRFLLATVGATVGECNGGANPSNVCCVLHQRVERRSARSWNGSDTASQCFGRTAADLSRQVARAGSLLGWTSETAHAVGTSRERERR